MKKITFLRSIMFAFAIMFSNVSFSQERTCGMEAYMEEQMKDPEFASQHKEMQAQFKVEVEKVLKNGNVQNRGGGNQLVIPVAVHFPEGNEADRACLEALAQNQIDILNADYTATNTDISNWVSDSFFYPNTNIGSSNIYFCLATLNHPAGIDDGLVEGGPAVTIGYDFGGGNSQDANWAGYMNFLIKPIGELLGFSPLGGSIASGQAVTMNTFAFGSGAGCPGFVPSAPYNLGRTVTHELGHFYNLDHTFNGDGNGICGVGGDGLADTPEVANSSYGCPTAGIVSGCVFGESALTMNYMDYVNDACMYMFTQEQAARTTAYLNVLQAQFKANVTECLADPGFDIMANNSPVFSCPDNGGTAVFNFTYTSIAGFDETTTFSATGVPSGATVSFSPATMNATGDFTMTVGNIAATAEGEYNITVLGTSATVSNSVGALLKNTCTSIQCAQYESAQNLNLNIADGGNFNGTAPGTPLLHAINVPNSQIIESIKVNVDITHTFIQDLLISIVHPDGTTYVDLWVLECGNFDNMDVTFDDEGVAVVCASPTNGTFIPDSPLSLFNGMDSQGDWTIFIQDYYLGDPGVLNDWSLEICYEAELSTDEFELQGFNIFPNPNNGEFTIKLNSNSGEDVKVDIYDIRGRVIFNNVYSNTPDFTQTINLNNVQSGMYLVNVNDGKGQVTKKIIVE